MGYLTNDTINKNRKIDFVRCRKILGLITIVWSFRLFTLWLSERYLVIWVVLVSVVRSFVVGCQLLIYVVVLKNQTYNVMEKNRIHMVVLCKSLSCVCHPTRTKLGNVYTHATEGRKSRREHCLPLEGSVWPFTWYWREQIWACIYAHTAYSTRHKLINIRNCLESKVGDVDELLHNLTSLLQTFVVNLLWKRPWHWHAWDMDSEHGYERAWLVEIQSL